MKNSLLKTRRGKLKRKLEEQIVGTCIDEQQLDKILKIVDEYEKDNLETINKLKRLKSLDTNRINGALKQTINAHGPITKVLIGSATKRIYGSLLQDDNNSGDKITIHKSKIFLFCVVILILLITSFIF
jgi:hypothetical protein